MHACIAALSQCIPAVGIAYSKKFKGVFETVGVENLIADPRTMGKEEIIEVICTALKYRMKVKAKLQQIMPQVKNNIYDIFKDIDMAL
jgi:polysaccharide pyruvyl transferase WcaK-like protein